MDFPREKIYFLGEGIIVRAISFKGNKNLFPGEEKWISLENDGFPE